MYGCCIYRCLLVLYPSVFPYFIHKYLPVLCTILCCSESEQVTESGDVEDKKLDGHVNNKHENVDEEAEEEEEEDITDSQMMTCFSQC